MPFQSEKQRRYLWANEPEIARDWTDTYGSRIESNTGGISRLGFANGPNYQVAEEEEEENPLEKFLRFMQGNAGQLSQADVTANKNFLKNYNVGFAPNNPYQMTSGPFQGMNAPGSSAFGSKTPQEMAQNWALKNQHRKYKTPEMQKKQQNIINIATGGKEPGTGTTITGHGKSGMGRDPEDKMMADGGRIGFADRGSYNLEQYKKERSMIDQWMYDQQMEEELRELERKKKVNE